MKRTPIITGAIILICLFILSSLLAGIVSFFVGDESINGNVAVIDVKGVILTDGGNVFDESAAASSTIMQLIEQAESSEQIQAIVLEINSPGGAAVPSEEIAHAVRDAEKPVVAWIRGAGASGGYWVASASDHIIASRVSITGSIGVISSYLDYSGLMERYNVTYQRLVSGKYKDAGSPFRELSDEEEALFQAKIDRLRDIFIEEVAFGRNMTFEEVEIYADGMFLLGEEAYEAGLVDELGGKSEVVAYLEDSLNTTVVLEKFEPQITWANILAGVLADHGFAVGEGLGASLTKPKPTLMT